MTEKEPSAPACIFLALFRTIHEASAEAASGIPGQRNPLIPCPSIGRAVTMGRFVGVVNPDGVATVTVDLKRSPEVAGGAPRIVTMSSQVAARREVMTSCMGGETVILNLDTETYFGLDDVGTAFWAALCESESVQAAVDRLLNEFDVDATQLSSDVLAFVETLLNHGLVDVR